MKTPWAGSAQKNKLDLVSKQDELLTDSKGLREREFVRRGVGWIRDHG